VVLGLYRCEERRRRGLTPTCVFQLHMLGDGSRGAIIEMTLAKVLHTTSESFCFGVRC